MKTEKFITKVLNKFPHNIDRYSYKDVNYIKNNIKVNIICLFHSSFEQTPENHLKGKGCPLCRHKGDRNTLIMKLKRDVKKDERKTMTVEEYKEHTRLKKELNFIKRSGKIHYNKYSYNNVKYKHSAEKINIECPLHGLFPQSPSAHLKGKGCPNCKKSKGEIEIERLLNRDNTLYETQYTFKDCKDKRMLKFDFYLPDFNLCIEYQGEQHYKPVQFWGGIEGLITSRKRDKIKRDYCKTNGIKLLEIKFSSFSEIENILTGIKSPKINVVA